MYIDNTHLEANPNIIQYEDRVIELDENKINFMVSQNAIPSKQYLGSSKAIVFTEQGVSVLRSKKAIQISIEIIYHIGASLKDLGNKWFAFSKLENDNLELLGKVNKILEGKTK